MLTLRGSAGSRIGVRKVVPAAQFVPSPLQPAARGVLDVPSS